MATYIHYERFCPLCKRYYEGKIPTCNKCNGVLKITNKWYVTFRTEEFGIKKQKKLGSYETKSAAERAYMEYNVTDNRPTSAYTFEMLAYEVIERHKNESKSSSYLAYKNMYFNRLKMLLKLKVDKITESDLRNVYNSIKNSKYAANSQKATWGALGHALYYAAIYKNIDRPYKTYKKFKTITAPVTKKSAWTINEWKKFITTIYNCYLNAKNSEDKNINDTAKKHYMFYVFFNYLVHMGNRRGEMLALKVSKIDFKKKIVIIDESITFEILPEERKKGLTYKTTDRKNHKVLIEKIPDNICKLLKEYINVMNLKNDDFMFFRNAPLSQQIVGRHLDYYIRLAEVPRITLHQFRHTLASIIFATGNSKVEDAYVVAQRLGHDVKYTLDTYGSIFEDRESTILNNLNL